MLGRKVWYIILILSIVFLNSSCGSIVDNKYTTSGYGNITPVTSLKYYVGNPTYLWAGGYFANLTANRLNLYNTNTQISRDGAGNMIFTDAVSGTKTLAQLTVGSGGNISGTGSLNRTTYWTSASTIGDTSMYFDVPNNRYGVGTTAPQLGLHIHNGSGPDGIQLSYTIGALYTNITSDIFGFLRLMPSGQRVGINDLTPSTALDVTGTIHATGNINADQDINATNDLSAGNDLNVTDDADISGDLRVVGAGRIGNTLNMTTHQIINVVDPTLAQDAATKNYVDTMTSIPSYNVFNVAKSGATYTTIQSAINAASPTANATFPALVRIAPGVYNEALTCASYVHLASIGGSYGTVIVQQTDADICTLPVGTTNIAGITFRLVTPTAARTVFKDNGNANYCYLDNCAIEITTPSTYAHKLIAISGTGTVLVLNNFYSVVGGTGASRGIDITSAAVVTSSGMSLSFNNANAFDLTCSSSGAVVTMMNSVLGGTASLFNVTGGTFQWTGCRLTGTGTGVINTNTTHYAENCFIDSGVYAQDGSEVRLRNCSYRYVYRVGTGNIIDTSRKLQAGIFHVVDYTWNTQIAYANVAVRKSGTGDIQTGGSGQGVAGVRLNSVSYAGVENNADVTGGLDSSFNCTRTIRMHQVMAVNQLPANGKLFVGVRQTVGNAIPTPTGAENYAGFSWNGTACRLTSSNGGGVGQITVIASPLLGEQHSIEIEILGSKRVDFYCDGVLVGRHTTAAGIPSGMLDWQRLVTSDGGGDATFMYMTLRNGFIEECPQ